MNTPSTSTSPNPIEGNLQALIDAGAALGTPTPPKSGIDIIVVPDRYKAVATERPIGHFRDNPPRTQQVLLFEELDSFISYVEQFRTPLTKLFASRAEDKAPSFTAVIDYHDPKGTAAWCAHRANYRPAFSVEWERVMESDTEHMSQGELCQFLETNADLITDPPGASLLELALNLEGHNEISCQSLMRLNNGKTRLVYSEDVSLKGITSQKEGAVDFPDRMTFAIAPFDGGSRYAIKCRMRYRIGSNRRLEFWFETIDVHLVLKSVTMDMVTTIAEKLAMTPLFGSMVG